MNDRRFTVLVTHAIPQEGLYKLKESCEVMYPAEGSFSEGEIRERLPLVDAVLAGAAMTAEMIERAPRLKIISNYGAGYDRVDVEAADRCGVIVTNIPDSTADATAELALSLILAVSRRICELDRRLRAYPPEESFGMGTLMGHSLFGNTLGIVGMGRIGARLAEMARVMGMKTAYHNRRRVEGNESEYLPLDQLMASCDVISINCPLTPETRGLISAREIALMKPEAILVNTSRGAVINNEALIGALASGAIRGAGIDVFPDEPHVPEGYLALENVVLTPHVGTNTHEARRLMGEHAALRITEVAAGRIPPNIVGNVRSIKDA